MSKPIDDLIAKYGGSELPRVTRKVRKTTSELAWKRGFDEARAATAAREIIEHSRAAAARREGIERTGEIPIDLESLVESISIVKHAVSADTTRPQFNSVLIEGSRGMLSVTATDGVRLCHVELPCEHVPHVGFLIPQESIKGVMELGSHDRTGRLVVSAKAEMNAGERPQVISGQVRLSSPRGAITFNSEGSFPPWDRVIPEGHDITVHAGIEELIAMLKPIPIIENIHRAGFKKHRETWLVFSPLLGGLKTMSVLGITQAVHQVSSSDVQFMGQFPYEGSLMYNASKGLVADIDGNFMVDALKAFRSGGASSVEMKLTEDTNPLLDPIKIESSGNGGIRMIEVFQPYDVELIPGMLEMLPYYCEHSASRQ